MFGVHSNNNFITSSWDEKGTPKLRTLLDQSIEGTKLTVQLWNSPHECVKMSKLKMSQTNIRNEPVRLKNIRLGTQAI